MSNPAIKEALRSISEANGGLLLPEKVVDSARDESSCLHSWFEWDDSTAAENHRIWQARQLIRVVVQTIDTNRGPKEAQVYVSLTPDRKEGGYREFVSVMSDKEMRAQLLHDALEELNRMENKYGELKELAAIFAAMRKLRKAA